MTDSIRARFDRYDRDYLDWVDLKARADRAGRTPREQEAHEEAHAYRVTDEVRRQVVAEINETRARTGRHSTYERRDPWPVRGGRLIDDPIHDGRF